MRARRPSGRPGTRWLRIDREPLSTERPGPTRVTPSPTPLAGRDPFLVRIVPVSGGRGRWTWLAWGGTPARSPRDPVAPSGCAGRRRSVVRWWTRPNLPADRRTLSTPVAPGPGRSVARSRRSAASPGAAGSRWAPQTGARTGTGAHHPSGRTRRPGSTRTAPPCPQAPARKTSRPPTTVTRHSGRGPPGVRSGRPGVPERGSVDQRATRSSGACTTRAPVRQTA